MRIKNIRKKFLRYAGIKFVPKLIDVLCKSLKITEINKNAIGSQIENGAVFAFWHGTMILPWFLLKEYKPTAIISKSKDGDQLVNVLNKWNYKVLRGSSSSSGKEVLEKLVAEASDKKIIAITPDGPKGPEKKMKAGAVIIAKKAKVPLFLLGIKYKNSVKLKSWDNFEIPYFFTKAAVVYSDPILIESSLDYEKTDMEIKKINNVLVNLQNEAESSL